MNSPDSILLRLVEHHVIHRSPPSNNDAGVVYGPNNDWCIELRPRPSEKDEGVFDAIVFDSANDVLWSGALGGSVTLGPVPGRFVDFSPLGASAIGLYNLSLSASPVSTPSDTDLYPMEIKCSSDGEYVLLVGYSIALYDFHGREYFRKRLRSDMQAQIDLLPSAKLVAVADLLKVSAMNTEQTTLPAASRSDDAVQRQAVADTGQTPSSGPARSEQNSDRTGVIRKTRIHPSRERSTSPERYTSKENHFVTILGIDGNVITEFATPFFPRSMALSRPNGERVVVANYDSLAVFSRNGLLLWQVSTLDFAAYIITVSASDSGDVVAIANRSRAQSDYVRYLAVWTADGAPVGEILSMEGGPFDEPTTIDLENNTIEVEQDTLRTVYKVAQE